MDRTTLTAALAGMVAGVAHEVGNPLNFAQGGATSLDNQLARIARLGHGPTGEVSPTDGELGTVLAAARRALVLVHSGHRRIARIMDNLRGYMQARVVE